MEMLTNNFVIPGDRVGLLFDPIPVAKACQILEQRHLREEILGTKLFGDPGWELMLDLYVAQASGKRVSVTSAAIGCGRPMSTGLRWVRLLIQHGHVVREADPEDGRRHYLALTETALDSLEQFLSRC